MAVAVAFLGERDEIGWEFEPFLCANRELPLLMQGTHGRGILGGEGGGCTASGGSAYETKGQQLGLVVEQRFWEREGQGERRGSQARRGEEEEEG